jgi:hypothetical protein
MTTPRESKVERCAICGCLLHRSGEYAKPTVKGRSHATEHHFVAERFFGRSKNRKGTVRPAIFRECPWNLESEKEVFCYECHEELLHNPVFLPEDVREFGKLVQSRGLGETKKPQNRKGIAGRIKLFNNVIRLGIEQSLREGQ